MQDHNILPQPLQDRRDPEISRTRVEEALHKARHRSIAGADHPEGATSSVVVASTPCRKDTVTHTPAHNPEKPLFGRYERLRPDDLAAMVSRCPVAYLPLGLLEHHGWHLPIGFDGLKADGLCERLAERVGGVILPTMWWGGGGGHHVFKWTHYQSQSAYSDIVSTTVRQLFDNGFRAIVVLAGHYPWQQTLDRIIPPLRDQFADRLLLAGTELTIGGDLGLAGDHAALEETSYGLALFPDLVDMKAMTSGRGEDVWPQSGPPAESDRHPAVEFDPAKPLFAQMGEDSRLASGARGTQAADTLLNALQQRLDDFLAR